MKSLKQHSGLWSACIAAWMLFASVMAGQGEDRLTGIWVVDHGFQTVELLFRSEGRFQMDTRSTEPNGFSYADRGRYEVNGQILSLAPYQYFGEPQSKPYQFEIVGDTLTLTTLDFPITEVYQFKPGSRADVLAREEAPAVLVGTWGRHITFYGREEYTFRPGGYYFSKSTPEGGEFPPEIVRGRYEQEGGNLIINPYGGMPAQHEVDFFGDTMTIITRRDTSGESASYELVSGSEAAVRAKAAEAEAFLSNTNWHVGVWEIRNGIQTVDLTLRPDGHYISKEDTEFLEGIVRGRYVLEPGEIRLFPFVGQGLYAPSNGEFGKVERTRAIDFYDGELQFIDLQAISQSVTIGRKRSGTEAAVLEKTRVAKAERERAGWHIGIWEVNDPQGWMEFTFRPDGRYIAKSGTDGVPFQVERGWYVLAPDKFTLNPYPGLGSARGFELDLYDGDLFLVGDLLRMVVASNRPGSEVEVVAKTQDPNSMKGERGSILGAWTANRPGEFAELVFRDDGEYRLKRCANDAISHDYGLFAVNLPARSLVYDSRFTMVQNQGLDFYGDTMTIYGGVSAPSTYVVNLGTVDAAIDASFAADAAEGLIDTQWLARVPVGPKDPNAVQVPVGNIPADPNPTRIFPSPTVLQNYQLYRRLISTFVYFNDQGTIKSLPVVNTREWHFFPTGRVMIRFTNHRAGPFYPDTVVDETSTWGAYRVEPKPVERDILHIYAENGVIIETDLGESMEMTLEDGRRHLFWEKDYMILSEWATEQKAIPCQLPGGADASLINTPVSLSTSIEPDPVRQTEPMEIKLKAAAPDAFVIEGTAAFAGEVVVERASSLQSPVTWKAIQTNTVPVGAFSISIPQGNNREGFFRLRQ